MAREGHGTLSKGCENIVPRLNKCMGGLIDMLPPRQACAGLCTSLVLLTDATMALNSASFLFVASRGVRRLGKLYVSACCAGTL